MPARRGAGVLLPRVTGSGTSLEFKPDAGRREVSPAVFCRIGVDGRKPEGGAAGVPPLRSIFSQPQTPRVAGSGTSLEFKQDAGRREVSPAVFCWIGVDGQRPEGGAAGVPPLR